jgi:hypothetical protein
VRTRHTWKDKHYFEADRSADVGLSSVFWPHACFACIYSRVAPLECRRQSSVMRRPQLYLGKGDGMRAHQRCAGEAEHIRDV